MKPQARLQPRMALCTCWLAVLIASGGCQNGETTSLQERNKLGALAVLYGKYVGSHGGRMPPNQQEFVSFIHRDGAPILKQFGLAQADELFMPGRDGQSIVVRYSASSVTDPNPVIAYESQPIGENRKVLRSTGSVEELSETEFQQLLAARTN